MREEKGLLLRQAAAFLETDTAFVSKIERGERKTNRDHVEKLAQFLQTDKDQLITIWLADKILDMINTLRHNPYYIRIIQPIYKICRNI